MYPTTEFINKEALSVLLQDPSYTPEIVDTKSGFCIGIKRANMQAGILATARGQKRIFKKLDTAYEFLKSLKTGLNRNVIVRYHEGEF